MALHPCSRPLVPSNLGPRTPVGAELVIDPSSPRILGPSFSDGFCVSSGFDGILLQPRPRLNFPALSSECPLIRRVSERLDETVIRPAPPLQ
jgi:hypothetical protein